MLKESIAAEIIIKWNITLESDKTKARLFNPFSLPESHISNAPVCFHSFSQSVSVNFISVQPYRNPYTNYISFIQYVRDVHAVKTI